MKLIESRQVNVKFKKMALHYFKTHYTSGDPMQIKGEFEDVNQARVFLVVVRELKQRTLKNPV